MSCSKATTTMINGLATVSSKTEVLPQIKSIMNWNLMTMLITYGEKTGQKLNVLARVAPFMNVSKERIYQIAVSLLSSFYKIFSQEFFSAKRKFLWTLAWVKVTEKETKTFGLPQQK